MDPATITTKNPTIIKMLDVDFFISNTDCEILSSRS
jgi:hypothetical protein